MGKKQNWKENRKKWVEALRSGEYRQGSGSLRTYDDKFCCLGVLADLGKQDIAVNDEFPSPKFARDFVGMRTCSGDFRKNRIDGALWECNDERGWDFDQIADLIESEPEGLFLEIEEN